MGARDNGTIDHFAIHRCGGAVHFRGGFDDSGCPGNFSLRGREAGVDCRDLFRVNAELAAEAETAGAFGVGANRSR